MTDAATARRAFLDALSVGESAGRYNVLYGGKTFSSYAAFPQWAGVRVDGSMTHAAGRYQFEPATWKSEVARLGLKDFSPASQDAGAWDLAARTYAKKTGRNLEADLMAGDATRVAAALHSTWTSLESVTFPPRFSRALAAAQQNPAPSNDNSSGGIISTVLGWLFGRRPARAAAKPAPAAAVTKPAPPHVGGTARQAQESPADHEAEALNAAELQRLGGGS